MENFKLEIESKIEELRKFSIKLHNLSIDKIQLVEQLNSITTEKRNELFQKYQYSDGPIIGIRKEVATILSTRNIQIDEIMQIEDRYKDKYPNSYGRMYKDWFNVFYMFLIADFRNQMKTSIESISNYLINVLEVDNKLIAKKFDFTGERETGSTRCWIAIINKTHYSQTTAKQLFIQVQNGELEYCFYDRPNDLKEEVTILSQNEGVDLEKVIEKFKNNLDDILDDSYMPIINYWRIGSKDSENNYWEEMKLENKICIGWAEIGDLIEEDIKNKKSIIKLLENEGFYIDDNRTKSRKAGEIFNFYEKLKINDIVLVQNGETVLGIGRVVGEYSYNSNSNFPHQKTVEWLCFDPTFFNEIGNQTTCYQIKDGNKIIEINNAILKFQNQELGYTISNNKNMKQPLNQILYGPPGTGKTYNSIKRALEIIYEDEEINLDWNNRTAIKALFDKQVDEGRIVFSTFHQSMSYEDFIEGIKPLKPEEEDDFIKYDVEPGIFKQICSAAESNEGNLNTILKEFKSSISEYDEKPPLTIVSKATTFDIKYTYGNVFMVSPHNTRKEVKPWYYVSIDNIISYFNTNELSGTNPTYTREITKYLIENKGLVQGAIVGSTKPYVIIIDEINRGNVSQIFGELITLIEEDKRKGNPEALKIMLPYSKIKFSVPSNLYIVGTMNTADRSVEALDTALRRRFTFEEIPPNEDLDLIQYDVFGTTASAILKILNARIEKLLDKDHKLGHSFFIKKDAESAEGKIVETFYKNIIPLLQEYFFGDFGKIGLVLGKGFVTVDNSNESIFADFDYESKEDYQVKEIYSIKDFRINNNMDGFKDAIQILMTNK